MKSITPVVPVPPLTDSSAAAVFRIDQDWRVVAVNPRAVEFTGRRPEELVGLSAKDIFCSGEHFAELAELCASVTEGRCVTNHPVLLRNEKDQSMRTVLFTVVPMPGSREDQPEGALVCLQDATDAVLAHQLALDSVADGVFTVNQDWRITSFNRAAQEMTGWSLDEVLGRRCGEIFHSGVCGEECLLAEAIREGKSIVDHSLFIRTKGGTPLPVSISAAPLYNGLGQVIGGVETFRDTSTSVKNDLILDAVADGVFTVDHTWQITSFNRAAEQITGWSHAEVLGKPCHTIFHSSVCGEACLLQRAIAEKCQVVDQSIFIRRKDGEIIPVTISASPLLDHGGQAIGGVETFRDSTASIRNDLILDSVADGVFTVDRNWRITSFNRAAEEITGWERGEAMGRSCSEIFHSSICGRNCAIAECLYSGKPVSNRSITIVNRAGEEVPISISAAPLTDFQGNIIGGVETFRDLTAITSLRAQLNKKYSFDKIISKSASMQRLFAILPEIARSPSTVLITGESGTGKELVARAIYAAGDRADKPFVVVNCGALPETLLESELFGYKAGAFTDARKDKEGRFAAAEGGTLFLDEIGDIPLPLQVKLLRVLQNKVYEPLGSNTPVKADVRIITATNRDLQALVREGRFREDLFYRLNVVRIQLPSLRERKEDIPLLVDHFIKRYALEQGKDIVGISSAALNLLMRYDFPGNIRELENIIEYSFILCEGGYIQPEHLPETFAGAGEGGAAAGEGDQAGAALQGGQSLEEIERQAIALALERNNWRKMATCRELGISKDTLRRKIKRYGLRDPRKA